MEARHALPVVGGHFLHQGAKQAGEFRRLAVQDLFDGRRRRLPKRRSGRASPCASASAATGGRNPIVRAASARIGHPCKHPPRDNERSAGDDGAADQHP